MKIDIRMATNLDSPAQRHFAEHELTRKLGARIDRIGRARIRLNDVNGPRGGVDKLCHLRLEVARGRDVSATGESGDWYEAVAIAVTNARSALDRRLERARERRTWGRPVFDFADEAAGGAPAVDAARNGPPADVSVEMR